MRTIAKGLLAAGLLGVTLSSCARSPIKTSVCEVASHPSQFDGKLIQVEGSIITDGMHGSSIEDPGCGLGVGFNASEKVLRRAGSDRILSQVNPMISGVGFEQSLNGVVVGRFRSRSGLRMLTATRLDVKAGPRPPIQLRCPGGRGPVAADEPTARQIARRAVAAYVGDVAQDPRQWTMVLEGKYATAWQVFQFLDSPGDAGLKGGGRPEFRIDKCTGEVSDLMLSK